MLGLIDFYYSLIGHLSPEISGVRHQDAGERRRYDVPLLVYGYAVGGA